MLSTYASEIAGGPIIEEVLLQDTVAATYAEFDFVRRAGHRVSVPMPSLLSWTGRDVLSFVGIFSGRLVITQASAGR